MSVSEDTFLKIKVIVESEDNIVLKAQDKRNARIEKIIAGN